MADIDKHGGNRFGRFHAFELLALMLTCSLASPVLAAVGYQMGAAANYSDNISRAPTDATDDVVANANGALLWTNDSPRLSADVFTQLSYLDYVDDTFDDELVPRADATIDWEILPARMSWVLQDRFGQIASDPFAAFTPDNIENTNVLRTGPDFIFGSSPSQLLLWRLRAEDQYYEDQAVDNQRLNSTLELQRFISKDRSTSLSVFGETVKFDDGNVASDYDLYEAYLTYEQSLSNYEFLLEAGGTEIRIGDRSVDGVLGRLEASRTFDTNWTVQVTGEYSYTDSGSRFLIGREQSSAGPGQVVDDENLAPAGSPLRLRMISLDAVHHAARHDLSLNAYWEAEKFELDPLLDRKQFGGGMQYELLLSQLNSVILAGSYKRMDFDASDRKDDNAHVELRFRRNLTKNLSLDLRLARVERSSSDITREYDENIAGISLSWRSDVLRALTNRSF